jgi:hypothetical protein
MTGGICPECGWMLGVINTTWDIPIGVACGRCDYIKWFEGVLDE